MMNDIIKAGVQTKVLMLSATPVNSKMTDLKNQVAFITEGNDDVLKGNGISSLDQVFKSAQTKFNQWLKLDTDTRSIKDLLQLMDFSYFKILDIYTIARSRKHIEKYYDTSEIGKFPNRLKPVNIKTNIDKEEEFLPIGEINKTIQMLNLSAYSPLKYVRPEKKDEYDKKYDIIVKGGGSVFKQIDREQSLIHLMRVNLLKRMESSIHSFELTLKKLHFSVSELLKKIDQHSQQEIEELSIEDVALDSDEFDDYLIGNKVKVLIKDTDQIKWKADLEEDLLTLDHLLRESSFIQTDRDAKLIRLKEQITEKVQSPINSGNKKVIVFTAFADTANYLYENISKWAKETHSLHTALITGSGRNQTTHPKIKKELNTLLTHFSPRSKELAETNKKLGEIDLLIATDCISEGQNLQDCDYLINYDIHWNPVRIIQRFGRVDRLGSVNENIQLVNFWPNMELDEYINLESRVSGRMVLLDISATGEENVIDTKNTKMNDLEYRKKQLQELQDNVVDLEDISGGISITDLTLNDFKMDLSDFLKDHHLSLEASPSGLYGVSSINNNLKNIGVQEGVIFCLKNTGKPVQVDDSYGLAPYFLVYVANSGDVVFSFKDMKVILDILKKQGLGSKRVDGKALARFHSLTNKAKDMSLYHNLLEKAVENIAGKSDELGTLSLFSRGGTSLEGATSQQMDDFEVVSYFILVEG
jgi:hypothetical protein